MKPDLTLLYSELDLKPNCTLAELQLAYRRRISELQPHRNGGVQSPESVAVLRDLIWLYTSATRFHRRYGRLPGAAPHGHVGTTASMHRGSVQHVPTSYSASPSDDQAPPPLRIAFWVAMALLVVLFILVAVASGEWLR
ncbi:hypothetical protein [Lysobacter tyrosinilyticus]